MLMGNMMMTVGLWMVLVSLGGVCGGLQTRGPILNRLAENRIVGTLLEVCS